MKTLKQSTAYNLMVLMVDSTDHITGKASLTLTITASKAGAAFSSISPTVTDRGSGWYNLALTSAMTDTTGDLVLHVTATGADPVDISMQVFTSTNDDFATAVNLTAAKTVIDDIHNTDLPAVKTETASIKTKTDLIPASPAAVGSAMTLTSAYDAAKTAAPTVTAIRSEMDSNSTKLGNLDATISSRLATVGYTTPPTASDIATAVWGATTRTLSGFGTLIADIWGYATRTLSAFGFTVATNSDSNVSAIKTKTDNLPASPAAVGSAMTLTSDYDAAKTAATQTSVNAIPTNPLLANSVILPASVIAAKSDLPAAPDNAGISAIKAKTDNLPSDPADESLLEAAIVGMTVNVDTSAIADAVLDESATGHTGVIATNLDAKVSSRLATAGYTTPPTASDIASAVWGATTRPTASTLSTVAGNDVIAYAGDSLSFSLTGLGSLSDVTKLYLSVKTNPNDADSASIIQLENTAGLLYLNGAAGTAGNGTLVIIDAALGNITATLTPAETVKIIPGFYFYDVKAVRSTGSVNSLTQGKITFVADITKAVA